MKVSMAVVATMTRGIVMAREGAGFGPVEVDGMGSKENIKILLWHLYAGSSKGNWGRGYSFYLWGG
jgi:hypothetical protein